MPQALAWARLSCKGAEWRIDAVVEVVVLLASSSKDPEDA